MPTLTPLIPTPDGRADAFAAFPDCGGPHPAVLMYPDAFGLRPVLKEMAEELAGHGYHVLVPNLYYRHGPAPVTELPGHIGEDVRPAVIARLMPLIRAHTTERVLRDADAYLDFLAGCAQAAPGPVAAIGYCVGGVLAVRTGAARPDRVSAVAAFHPSPLVTGASDSPHLGFPRLTARVHLGLAEGDMTADSLGELTRALDAAGVNHTTELYPGTLHGFTMADTDALSPSGLHRHRDRLLTLLTEAPAGS